MPLHSSSRTLEHAFQHRIPHTCFVDMHVLP